MRRRIYWLLPDLASATRTENDLLLARIAWQNIHFVGREGADMSGLHAANVLQTSDVVRAAQAGLVIGAALGAVIGVVAGWLVVVGVFFWERRGIDDPVGAISVHGVNGLWGLLSVGIFATGEYGAGWNGVVRDEMVKLYGADGVRGLLYGDFSQFIMQIIDCAAVAIFGFIMAYVWFKVSDLITPIRVDKETEVEGLDGPEMGTLGYPDFQIHRGQE